MDNENLYILVKKRLCEMIYKGIYSEGDKIPPERILAEELNVSRVTVRKALQLMEDDRLIVREVGSGTSVSFHNTGHSGTLDMITLVAPATSPFFSAFIEAFQKNAELNNSLVLFVQKPEKESIENCLYRLYQRDLYNVVVWLDDMKVDLERLRRLRALGMNMVFFDTDLAFPYADCVFLDNKKAIKSLCRSMNKRGCPKLGYIGWDDKDIFSVREREKAYLNADKAGRVLTRLSWKNRNEPDSGLKNLLQEHDKTGEIPDAIICGNGENGISVSKALQELKIDNIKVASIDEFAHSGDYGITTYGQNFKRISQSVYECLQQQNLNGAKWKADFYEIEGNLIER